jgi:diadenosine tetraphosphate (Ap4A) HIT family hydrolase
MSQNTCVYCTRASENVIWSDEHCRVLHIADSPFAGLCRVVWDSHVAELSDLDEASRSHVMRVVASVEKALREMLMPAKVNLASLGTMVPHLHWHVVPRYRDDSHYPEAIWAAPQREGVVRPLPDDFADRMKQSLDAAMT